MPPARFLISVAPSTPSSHSESIFLPFLTEPFPVRYEQPREPGYEAMNRAQWPSRGHTSLLYGHTRRTDLAFGNWEALHLNGRPRNALPFVSNATLILWNKT